MRIGFLLSTLGGSPLQVGLDRGLNALGHNVEDYNPNASYDLVLVWNQSAHTLVYKYPEFPKGNVPIAFIDCAEYGYFRRLPEVIHQYANTFSPGAMKHDTKNPWEQQKLKQYLEGKSFPYFIREFSKYVDFPNAYHPIDYPLYYHSECPLPPSRNEYLRRTLDLFCSWGCSHPWRIKITEALRNAHVKSEIQILEEIGADGKPIPRMPQELYFERTRAAKCSVSFDGYGSGSFRVTEVLVRCLLLQGPLSIHRYMPLIDGVHCVEYSVQSDGEKFLSTDVADKLHDALADPEGSYRIYESGFDHCMTYYTEKATAEYVLRVIEAHDWNKPTQLEIG